MVTIAIVAEVVAKITEKSINTKAQKMAGAARLELATPGFGDQCSTN